MPGQRAAGARLAVRRGLAHGRGDASADAARGRHLRRDAAEPERRAGALVVPWKYGFKSIKSIVKIEFVDKQPPTAWNLAAPRSTASTPTSIPKSIIRAGARRPNAASANSSEALTLMFNGYGDQVAVAVRRHGPEEKLLMPPLDRIAASKPLVFALCLAPLAARVGYVHRQPRRRSDRALEHDDRRLDAALPATRSRSPRFAG